LGVRVSAVGCLVAAAFCVCCAASRRFFFAFAPQEDLRERDFLLALSRFFRCQRPPPISFPPQLGQLSSRAAAPGINSNQLSAPTGSAFHPKNSQFLMQKRIEFYA
jgi:hypothetical protein